MKAKPKTSTYAYPKPNKQKELTAASLLRMGKGLSKKAVEYRSWSSERGDSWFIRGVTLRDVAEAMRLEAKKLRGMR